jgi:hypothetical protein
MWLLLFTSKTKNDIIYTILCYTKIHNFQYVPEVL